MMVIRSKFDILLKTFEKYTPNDEYENFVTAFIAAAAAAAKCIPTKPRNKCRVPLESIADMVKQDNMKNEYLLHKKNQQTPLRKNLRKSREN